MTRRALEGLRILDLTQIWAGPYCSRLLADMGAEVIKVESARRFDNTRTYGIFPKGITNPQRPWNLRALFNTRNRGKLGVTIDMTTAQGKALFIKLLKISDVVTENFSARVMASWSLDYPVLRQHKPDIIMLSMPAFGMTGPERDYVGQGSNLTPLSGLVGLTGYINDVPHNVGSYTDPIAGLTGAGAILAALHYRAETGVGQYIDLAQREGAARFIGDAIMDYTMNGRVWPLMGNRHPAWAPHGCYPCQGEDKWVAIAVTSDQEWAALCQASGHPEWREDPRFADGLSRHRHQDELDQLISAWTADRDHREVMELLQAAGLPAGAVLTGRDLFDDPQYAARGYFPEVTHPEAGTLPTLGVYAKLAKTPGYIARGAPLLGEHNQYVFGSLLGLGEGEIQELAAAGIISADPTAVAT
ncbi:MAG: CoA transferase [Chloroflexi bacterium]|nr:CoA transferase [Chloroflexota bacterium]